MSRTLPIGWALSQLNNLTERVTTRNPLQNKNVLTISAAHGLVNQKLYFNKYVASENLANYFLLNQGDFAYNKSYSAGYPVGVVRRLTKYKNGVVSPLYICFRAKQASVDSRYLGYFFDCSLFIKEVNSIAQEGARNHGLLNIGISDFFNIEVLHPQLKEQQRIAEILTSVDEVIENTQSQINKLEDLKKATMNELLTKGIGHTEFKDTEIGKIPKDWKVESLKTLATVKVSNVDKKSYDGEVQVRLCNYLDVYTSRYLTDDQKYMFSTASEREIAQFGLKQGDLVITKDSESPDDIGIPALIDSQVETLVCGYHLALISQRTKLVDPNYLLWWLQSHFAKKWFYVNANGTTRYGLPTGSIESLPVPIPSLAEQNRIGHIGRHLISELTFYKDYKNHQIALKQSLMQDLLTGKVRVTVN